MYIIVGLGNPGAKYSFSRHNMGFMTVERLAELHKIEMNKLKMKALLGEGVIAGERVVLVKPQTFMNLSGQSVVEVMHWYKAEMDHLLVVYDDIDIAPGALRIRPKGSAGSHNGMKNIIYLLGRDDFPRFRVGIGGKPEQMDLADYVISKIRPEDVALLRDGVTKAVKAIEETLENGILQAMNKYNG